MARASDFFVCFVWEFPWLWAMTGWVRTAPGLVLLFVTAHTVSAASPCSYPSFGADAFWKGHRGSPPIPMLTFVPEMPHPHSQWSRSSPARAGWPPSKVGWRARLPAGFILPGWSCCAARCWLVPLVLPLLCTPGMSSQARNRGEGSWWCALAHRRPLGWERHWQGEAGWWCWGSPAWGRALAPDWGKVTFLERSGTQNSSVQWHLLQQTFLTCLGPESLAASNQICLWAEEGHEANPVQVQVLLMRD